MQAMARVRIRIEFIFMSIVQLTYPALVVPNVLDLKSERKMFAKLVFKASS